MTRITLIYADFYIIDNISHMSILHLFVIRENQRYPRHPRSFKTS